MAKPQPTRRDLLRVAPLAVMAPLIGAPSAASRPYPGPNIIMVRFGGGVRRRETIEADTSFSPWLIREFAPRGTLFRNVVIDDAPHIKTSHGPGTLHLLTGRYDPYENLSDRPLGERFEPPAPTLFEYLRKAYGVRADEALILNGEDRTGEEFYTFSNDHQYGVEYRSEVLSLYRYKTWLLKARLAGDNFGSDGARRRAERQLEAATGIDPRRSSSTPASPRIARFWERWRSHYGDTGLANPRGDRLITELAIQAMNRLEPRMMLLNYQDPDYVHWGYASHYTRGIGIIDQSLRSLVTHTESHPAYAGNTVFVVVPDCGRDDNPLVRTPFQHHFGSRSAHEIWALFVGPGIPKGRVVNRETQQIDVARTTAAIAGLTTPAMQGSVLREAFA